MSKPYPGGVTFGQVHKARYGPWPDHCIVCGQRIRMIAGGTWVHSDTGAVAAPGAWQRYTVDTPEGLGRRTLLETLSNDIPALNYAADRASAWSSREWPEAGPKPSRINVWHVAASGCREHRTLVGYVVAGVWHWAGE